MKNLLLLSLSLLAISAQASDTNFYAGLGIGSANIEGPEMPYEIYFPGQKVEGNSGMASVYMGYNLNQNISFEVGYSDLEKINDSIEIDPLVNVFEPVNKDFSIDSEKVFINTKLQHPINAKFSAFGLLGYSFYDITYKATGGATPTSESESEETFAFGRDTPGDLEINAYQASVEMSF